MTLFHFVACMSCATAASLAPAAAQSYSPVLSAVQASWDTYGDDTWRNPLTNRLARLPQGWRSEVSADAMTVFVDPTGQRRVLLGVETVDPAKFPTSLPRLLNQFLDKYEKHYGWPRSATVAFESADGVPKLPAPGGNAMRTYQPLHISRDECVAGMLEVWTFDRKTLWHSVVIGPCSDLHNGQTVAAVRALHISTWP